MLKVGSDIACTLHKFQSEAAAIDITVGLDDTKVLFL